MSQALQQVSPLRVRMIEDMNMRKLAPKTQTGYIRAIKKLAHFLGHSPDQASAEDLRLFQLDMANNGTSRITMNATITALRFFFEVTIDKLEIVRKLKTVAVERKLPVVLSQEEVAHLLNVTHSLKYKAALSIAYGAGLRISEIVSLKISHIDSKRMVIRVEQGKGRKDRYAMLSPSLLKVLREWWKEGHANGKLLKGGWLFPGKNPVNPLSSRQLSRACRAAAVTAEIDKKVSMHCLRHSYATHLLEQNVDIRTIQVLLGHRQLETTALYTQVATNVLNKVISPIEHLQPPIL